MRWCVHFVNPNDLFSVLFSQFSCSVMSYSLQPPGLQHARLPWPSPTLGAYLHSCPLSRWCHPTISSSVIPFSSRLQSFPASGSFPKSQFFTSGGQSIGVSASASVLPMDGLVGSPCSPRDSQESSRAAAEKTTMNEVVLWAGRKVCECLCCRETTRLMDHSRDTSFLERWLDDTTDVHCLSIC